jgi:hypothetical protein
MFDTNIKSVQFSLLSDVKLGYDAIREKAIEQCQKALGLAQCIVELEYKEENI